MTKQTRTPFSKNNNKKTFRRSANGGYLIFILTFPLIFSLIGSLSSGNAFRAFVIALCIALYYFGGSSIRKGLYNQHHSSQRKWQRSAPFPWKITGAIFVAAATALASLFLAEKPLFSAIGFGLSALIGTLIVYGVDPKLEKISTPNGSTINSDEVIAALEEAEIKIQAIETASFNIKDIKVKNQLHRISSKAHDILHVIEEDPKDLRRARKFLNTYLDGTQRVINGYGDIQAKNIPNQKLDDSFREVLNTVESVFAEQHQKLLENDVLDLDIQIEVLQTQMKHEGVI